MSIPEEAPTFATEAEINSFGKHLHSSKRILALCGAGLSAASGIPTFRGSGTLWRNHKAASISNIETWEANPGLVWKYHADRRYFALKAKPNKGHVALASLAKKKKGFVCLTQNIDGLSERAKHPRERLYPLHGSLMDIKCTNLECDYVDKDNMKEVLCPALEPDEITKSSFSAKPTDAATSSSPDNLASKIDSLSIEDPSSKSPKEKKSKPAPQSKTYERPANALESILEALAPTLTDAMLEEIIPTSALPHCPRCTSLLRPSVVWFGESLSHAQFDEINAWIDSERKLDLMMVIGTMAEVYPAARFVQKAREKGARIAVVNLDAGHDGGFTVREGKDWFFQGDAAEILPVLFEGVLEN